MPELDADATERVDDLLYRLVREDGLPGLSVAITDGRETLYATGYGSRDLGENAPATADTVYGIGSVTKSFVALSVLGLVDDGQVALDDPVREYLDVAVPDEVTLHHLLTHSSGYPSLGTSEALIERLAGDTETGVPLGDREDFHHHLAEAREEVVADAGERFAYSNEGYVLLGEVIEAVDGRRFREYATEEVLAPLGMDRSTFDGDRFREFEDRMTPYYLDGEEEDDGEPDDAPRPVDLPERDLSAAPGGLLAPMSDMARYLRLQLNGGEARDGPAAGDRLLGADLLARAHEGHVETPDGPYGYGWRRRETCGRDLIGHSGSIGVSVAYAGFSPEDDLGIALAANGAPDYPMAVVGQGVLAALLGEDPHDAIDFFARRDRFDRYAGRYESYRGIRTATVERDGGFLRLDFDDAFGGATPLVPRDGTAEDGEFWALTDAGNRRPVAFREHEDGVDLLYERWRLHQQ